MRTGTNPTQNQRTHAVDELLAHCEFLPPQRMAHIVSRTYVRLSATEFYQAELTPKEKEEYALTFERLIECIYALHNQATDDPQE